MANVTNRFYVTGNAATNMLTIMNAYRNTRPGAWASGEELGVSTGRRRGIQGSSMRASFRSRGVVAEPVRVSVLSRCTFAGELTSSFVAPANIFWNPMPTPSMTASRMAQLMAPFLAALYPPRIASEPPVKKPAICVVLDRASVIGSGGYMQSRCT